MEKINTTFSAASIGDTFTCCGTRYRKRSSRTADILSPYGPGWFYFGANERVTIERPSALERLEALNLEICRATGAGQGEATAPEACRAYRDEMFRRRGEVAAAIYAARSERRSQGLYSSAYVEGLADTLESITHPR